MTGVGIWCGELLQDVLCEKHPSATPGARGRRRAPVGTLGRRCGIATFLSAKPSRFRTPSAGVRDRDTLLGETVAFPHLIGLPRGHRGVSAPEAA